MFVSLMWFLFDPRGLTVSSPVPDAAPPPPSCRMERCRVSSPQTHLLLSNLSPLPGPRTCAEDGMTGSGHKRRREKRAGKSGGGGGGWGVDG